MQNVEGAQVGGSTTLRGRPSSTRTAWEAAREADALDLNRLLQAGGEVETYVVPLWSNLDAPRCLLELRGFGEARVYVELATGEGSEEAMAAVAEEDGPGLFGAVPQSVVPLIHAAASLDLPLLLSGVAPVLALKALALAIGEDLTPREIAAVLRGEDTREPDAESRERARELLA